MDGLTVTLPAANPYDRRYFTVRNTSGGTITVHGTKVPEGNSIILVPRAEKTRWRVESSADVAVQPEMVYVLLCEETEMNFDEDGPWVYAPNMPLKPKRTRFRRFCDWWLSSSHYPHYYDGEPHEPLSEVFKRLEDFRQVILNSMGIPPSLLFGHRNHWNSSEPTLAAHQLKLGEGLRQLVKQQYPQALKVSKDVADCIVASDKPVEYLLPSTTEKFFDEAERKTKEMLAKRYE